MNTITGAIAGPWADKIRFLDTQVKTQVSTGAASYPLDVIGEQKGKPVLFVSYDQDGAAYVSPRALAEFSSVTFPLSLTIRIAKGGTIPIQIP
jgi:hypothetical protein